MTLASVRLAALRQAAVKLAAVRLAAPVATLVAMVEQAERPQVLARYVEARWAWAKVAAVRLVLWGAVLQRLASAAVLQRLALAVVLQRLALAAVLQRLASAALTVALVWTQAVVQQEFVLLAALLERWQAASVVLAVELAVLLVFLKNEWTANPMAWAA